MFGLMQDQPLAISSLIEYADQNHGDAEIVSRRVEGDIHRTSWHEVAVRSRQIANALEAEALQPSDRVATLAWNGYRHLELYYGVSGSGFVLHTVNPRLHLDQIAWIVNHAEDRIVCFDLSFVTIVQVLHALCPTVRKWIALCAPADLPKASGIPDLVSYEDWIGDRAGSYAWPQFDERTASSLCYTSGTTGDPKGVLYSHRSTLLMSYAAALPDVLNISSRDSIMPVAPMFHVNAWGIPYSAALAGAKLVFPGPAMDGQSVYELMEAEGVTFAAGVPTVWTMLLAHLASKKLRFSTLTRTAIGGSACSPTMIRAFQLEHGVEVLHGWGMTEMSPHGTIASPKRKHLGRSPEELALIREKQGRGIFGVDMKIIDADGTTLARDGHSAGELLVKGSWVVKDYFRNNAETPLKVDREGRGWFVTGDVATIDPDGYLRITDRTKDVIKSGGEWVSSIDVENIAVAHPGIASAACLGVPHPKWEERPVLFAVKHANATVTRDQLLLFYEGKSAKWQIPDDVIFVDALPVGPTGKVLKTRLRAELAAYVHPDLRSHAR